MSFARTESVTVTTDASGDATAYTSGVYNGKVSIVAYTKSDYDNGVDFVVSGEVTGQLIWDEDNVNSSKTVAPRQASHTIAGIASVYAGTDGALTDIFVVNERIKFVVAAGGNAKSGAFRVVVA